MLHNNTHTMLAFTLSTGKSLYLQPANTVDSAGLKTDRCIVDASELPMFQALVRKSYVTVRDPEPGAPSLATVDDESPAAVSFDPELAKKPVPLTR